MLVFKSKPPKRRNEFRATSKPLWLFPLENARHTARMIEKTSPFTIHVFVCTNDRHGERKSCGDGGSNLQIAKALKAAVEERGWKGQVRISQSGCLGLCAQGPNVVIEPKHLVFSAVSEADVPEILSRIEQILTNDIPY